MDRELVLAVLVAVLCGGALSVAGWWPTGSPVATSGRALEHWAWRRLWAPLAPAGLLLAALCGWALVEPADAERVPTSLLWGAAPFGAVLVRAAWRALRSVTETPGEHAVVTVGLWRPRIIVSARLAAACDERALSAAFAHEQAHARHRDPLRLWLAQIASDLLWPWPAARSRFQYWRQALELARDEDARATGIDGPDLAAAVLTALRLSRSATSPRAATLGGDASFAKERIARLMRPLEAESLRAATSALWLLALGLVSAVALGTEFGEPVVRTLLGAH